MHLRSGEAFVGLDSPTSSEGGGGDSDGDTAPVPRAAEPSALLAARLDREASKRSLAGGTSGAGVAVRRSPPRRRGLDNTWNGGDGGSGEEDAAAGPGSRSGGPRADSEMHRQMMAVNSAGAASRDGGKGGAQLKTGSEHRRDFSGGSASTISSRNNQRRRTGGYAGGSSRSRPPPVRPYVEADGSEVSKAANGSEVCSNISDLVILERHNLPAGGGDVPKRRLHGVWAGSAVEERGCGGGGGRGRANGSSGVGRSVPRLAAEIAGGGDGSEDDEEEARVERRGVNGGIPSHRWAAGAAAGGGGGGEGSLYGGSVGSVDSGAYVGGGHRRGGSGYGSWGSDAVDTRHGANGRGSRGRNLPAAVQHHKRTHTRNGSRSDSIRGDGRAYAGGLARRQEPAVKRHGCLSTPSALKLLSLLIALYNLARLWFHNYHPESGALCALTSDTCVDTPVSKLLLTIARGAAGALFPAIAFCIFSKCYASRYYLHQSWLTLIVDFEPTHKLHIWFGTLILVASLIHGAAHAALAVIDQHPVRLVSNTMNRSGVVATMFLLVLALPMMFGFLKTKIAFEYRKILHVLFIPFMVALCFHGRVLALLCGVLLAWYLADRLYFTTRMTFQVKTPTYKSVGRGTLVRFELPAGYQYKPGSYVQVNCPAISASEWHPFSLFPVPGARPKAGFHVEAVGDWTDEFFRLCLENPRMPLWITAAQPSVVEQTVYYDNVLLVCTGAGVTPAVSVAERFAKKKNVHLLWISRDAGMVAMFEKQLRRVKSTVCLTGKPAAQTKKRMIDLLAPSRGEVVVSTAAGGVFYPQPPPCPPAPFWARPNNLAVASGRVWGDLSAVEDGTRPAGGGDNAAAATHAGLEACWGVLRDDDGGVERDEGVSGSTAPVTEKEDDDSGEDTVVRLTKANGRGASDSTLEGSSAASISGKGRNRRRHRPSYTSQLQRARGFHPVAVNFGRPDIQKFISDTIQGTAVVAEWAPPAGAGDVGTGTGAGFGLLPPPPAPPVPKPAPDPVADKQLAGDLRKMLKRLNTGQLISKRDLMEADLSVVDVIPSKPSSVSEFVADDPGDPVNVFAAMGMGQPSGVQAADKWLVLYCGANTIVERVVARTCDELKVTWRKEYFSKW